SASAAHALSAQSHSLHVAVATVQAEITSLNGLNSALHDNTGILKDSLVRADGVITDAKCRLSDLSPTVPSTSTPALGPTPTPPGITGTTGQGLPPIDEILVAPTVVGKQLYDLLAEEAGIQQAIYALQGALVKGVIGPETWSRHTRGLAREAFLKRALGRKVAVGLGLDAF
ncbi:Suppressor protein stp22 of temperature-sensitive alpha-factor receptor and arginine permease, partial [Elasticomyces elasticus]